MRIKIEKKKCSGCRLCEMVCSLFHGRAINTDKSAIRILKDDLGSSMNTPVLCRQCKKMTCLEGIDIDRGREKQRFVWPAARAKQCPFQALHLFGKKAYHCDLCGGDPRCVKVCTPGAIAL